MDLEQAKERIAEVLKWDRKDVDRFSLPTLREMIREKDPELHQDISDLIERGQHLFSGEW